MTTNLQKMSIFTVNKIQHMGFLDFVVIILFLWFLWETAHSLDFYCVIVYNNIVTNIQVFVAKAFLRSDIFLVH